MADELGITKGAYSKIERGVTAISVERLMAIAKILGVEVNNFFETKQSQVKVEEDHVKVGYATKGDIQEINKVLKFVTTELNNLKTKFQELQKNTKSRKS